MPSRVAAGKTAKDADKKPVTMAIRDLTPESPEQIENLVLATLKVQFAGQRPDRDTAEEAVMPAYVVLLEKSQQFDDGPIGGLWRTIAERRVMNTLKTRERIFEVLCAWWHREGRIPTTAELQSAARHGLPSGRTLKHALGTRSRARVVALAIEHCARSGCPHRELAQAEATS
jgi:hypothetical protein